MVLHHLRVAVGAVAAHLVASRDVLGECGAADLASELPALAVVASGFPYWFSVLFNVLPFVVIEAPLPVFL